MIRDIGITFRFKGGPEAQTAMAGLASKYRDLNSTLSAKPSGGGFTHLVSGLRSIGKAAAGATAAVTGLAGATAVMANKLAQSRGDLTHAQADLRSLRWNDQDIAELERKAVEVSNRYAKIPADGFTSAAYAIQSAMSKLRPKEVAAVTETASLMGRVTKMQSQQATELMGALYGATGHIFSDEDPAEFARKWAAGITEAVNVFKAEGPQIASAAKNSVSTLAESGWSRAQMLNTWGSMITGGVSGEQAGTAAKQIALKAREGYAKVLMEASGIKEKYAKNKPALDFAQDQFSAKADVAWKQGPEAYFGAIKRMTDHLRAQGKDWKKILGQAFGEEPVNAIIALQGKLAELKTTGQQIANAKYSDIPDLAKEMNKGIGPQTDLLKQRVQNFWTTIASTYDDVVTGVYGKLGGGFMAAISGVESNLDRLRASVQSFSGSFAQSFVQGFSQLPGIQTSISGIAAALASPDPAKWAALGAEFGKLAGINLSELVAGLRQVGAVTADVAKIIGPVASGIASVIGAGRNAAGWISEHVVSRKGISSWWNRTPFPTQGPSIMSAANGLTGRPAISRVERDELRHYSAPTMQPNQSAMAATPPTLSAPRQQSAPTTIDNNLNIRLEVDGRVLAEQVERYRAEERNRMGLGYGEAWAGR